jgi:hypothetical protein
MKSRFFVGHLILLFVLYHAVALSYNIMVSSEPSPELFLVFFLGSFGLGIQFLIIMSYLFKKLRLLGFVI